MTDKTENTIQDNAKELLVEIARTILEELHEREETVRKIVANLAISEEKYKKAITAEVIRGIATETLYAFLPNTSNTPAIVKNNALQMLQRKLDRDLRIYGAK